MEENAKLTQDQIKAKIIVIQNKLNYRNPNVIAALEKHEPFKHLLMRVAVQQIINSGELQYKDSFLLPNGDVYFGEMKDDKRYGRGTQIQMDGSFQEGYNINQVGLGQMIKLIDLEERLIFNGDVYEGEWLNNQANGYRKFYHINGTVYKGQWENDKKDGKGEETYQNGSYRGVFVKLRNKARDYQNDGATYEGEYNKTYQKGMENINGQMEDNIVDSGKTIK